METAAYKTVDVDAPIRRIGQDPGHHFFGYYNKNVWDRTGRYLLANRSPMMDANPTWDMHVDVGYFDLQENDFYRVIGKTRAWNWQMGCQLQWLEGGEGRQVIYNVQNQKGNNVDFASVIHDLDSDTKKVLPLPVYAVAPDSRYALCIDYRRLYRTHETIGYAGIKPSQEMSLAPANDGIHQMDLATGERRLVISYDDLRNFHAKPSMRKAIHWVSHIEISPNAERFLFLHRWTERIEDETCFLHRLITANADGSDMRLLECSDHPLPQLAENFAPLKTGTYDYEKSEYQISHPMWRADNLIVVWGPHDGEIHYQLYADAENAHVRSIGKDLLTENGHMSFSPIDLRWLLSDTYPDKVTNKRVLFLYDTANKIRYNLGNFYADPKIKKENRCDLHPRWSRDGRHICIDSIHELERQMYIVDVSALVKS